MKKILFFLLLLLLLPTAVQAQKKTEAKTYQRIISLYAAHTEVLLRLGAKDQVVGVSAFESYDGPETKDFKPEVFSLKDDVEKFLAAKPDLILVRPMHLAAHSYNLEALQRSGITVKALQVIKASELYDYWRELGLLVGREKEAEQMIDDFDSAIAPYHQAASQRTARPGVFVEAIHQSVRTFTPDSIPMWLVSLAGGTNVASDAIANASGLIIAAYGPERLLSKASQIDIFIAQNGPMNMVDLADIKERKIYQPLKAVKEGRVYQISEDIFARPTPSLLEGLKLLAAWTNLKIDETEQGE